MTSKRKRAHRRALYKKRRMKDPEYVEKLRARQDKVRNNKKTKYRKTPIGHTKYVALGRKSYRIRRIVKFLKD